MACDLWVTTKLCGLLPFDTPFTGLLPWIRIKHDIKDDKVSVPDTANQMLTGNLTYLFLTDRLNVFHKITVKSELLVKLLFSTTVIFLCCKCSLDIFSDRVLTYFYVKNPDFFWSSFLFQIKNSKVPNDLEACFKIDTE